MTWIRVLLFLFCCSLQAGAWAFWNDDSIRERELPAEGRQVLEQIKAGGPFAYPRKDGSIFNNFEKLLPRQPRGYYREYTVPTPGAKNRGARRIVSGGNPPQEFYYTDDHYQSFRRIQE